MKLSDRIKNLNAQTRWMIVVIILLLAMIVTRWGSISHTAGEAIKTRFTPTSEQTDSVR